MVVIKYLPYPRKTGDLKNHGKRGEKITDKNVALYNSGIGVYLFQTFL